MSDIDRILEVVEQVRQERYPSLPPSLVGAILRVEADFMDNRVEASKRIGLLVEQYLEEQDTGSAETVKG